MSTTGRTGHDGRFASLRLYRKLAAPTDAVVAGLLWLICCVPVLTAGSATIALFRVTHRRILGAPVSPLREFGDELRTAPVERCGATLVVLLAVLGVAVTGLLGASMQQRGLGIALVVVACAGGTCLLGILSTFFAIVGIFPHRDCWNAVRMAIAVAMTRMSTALTTSVLLIAVAVAGALFPPFLMVAGSVWATLTVRIERQTLTRICRSAVEWSEEPRDGDVGGYYRPPAARPDHASSR